MDNKIFKKAKENNLENFQIMKTSKEELTIETFNDKLDKFETSNLDNYIVSAIYQDKKVSIITETLDDTIIPHLIEQAEYLDITTSKNRTTLENIQETMEYQIKDSKKISARMLKLNELKKEYPCLVEISSSYTEQIIKMTIITEQNKLYDTKKIISFSTEVVVNENGKNSTSYDSITKTDESPMDIENLTRKVIENAVDKLAFQKVASGTYQVILTSKVMGSILNKFINLFSADSLQKDTSLLVDKLGKKVFSEKINIVEDPCNPKLLGKRLFDNTGIKTTYKEIIKEGVFEQPLYDEKTAEIDKVQSTGNDYGEISTRNMYIEAGSKKLEELIQTVDNGILIDSVGGLHAGINQVSGDISIQSEGYYIKNGHKQYATKLFVLSTNIMDILNNVAELSNHIDFYLSTTASPDLLLDNIKITGVEVE